MLLVTICFFMKDGKVLLAMKKRGFGQGKWNGYGGKVYEGESIEKCATREIEEESGLRVMESDLKKAAVIDFSFENNEKWDQQAHVYTMHRWNGDLVETEEMKPQWFGVDALPLNEMWIADREWLPMVLSGKIIQGVVCFTQYGSEVLRSEYNETSF